MELLARRMSRDGVWEVVITIILILFVKVVTVGNPIIVAYFAWFFANNHCLLRCNLGNSGTNEQFKKVQK